MLALSLFVAVVATLSRMYRDSEMAIWFASGVSLARFVRPVLRTCWPVLLVVALLALFVWPWQNQRSVELKERFERRSDLSRVAPGQFQTSNDGSRVFFIERDAADSRTGRNVFILTSLANAESVTSARSGQVEWLGDDRYLVLSRGQRNEQSLATGEKTLARFESYRIQAGERVLSQMDDLPPKARTSLDLLTLPTPANQGELVWRLEPAPRQQLEPAVCAARVRRLLQHHQPVAGLGRRRAGRHGHRAGRSARRCVPDRHGAAVVARAP